MKESVSQKLASVQTFETRIIRRKYRIGFRAEITAADLINKIKFVPLSAVVDDIETDDDDGITTITFHDEVRAE